MIVNSTKNQPILDDNQIRRILELTDETAEVIMQYYCGDIDVSIKNDNSPVTRADLAASRKLEDGLPQILTCPVLSEENIPNNYEWTNWETYWVIDPIDGTKHYINKTGEFCICIALIHKSHSVFGLIYAPVTKTAWFAQQTEMPAEQNMVFRYHHQKITEINAKPPEKITATISSKTPNSKMERLLGVLPNYQWYNRCSALQYIDIIEGKSSLYPKMWDTCEWDSAAGQCILECAGGHVINLVNGTKLQYGEKKSLINPHFLAFRSLSSEQIEQLLAAYLQIEQ